MINSTVACCSATSAAPPATRPGDLDGDGDTDLPDLGILLAAFGEPCP